MGIVARRGAVEMKCLPGEILSKIAIKDNSCWDFVGARTGVNYGSISLGKRGCQRGAHIISFELYKGKVPKGLSVLHTCDNPPCVNPDHLFLGTHQSNKDDEISKGRHVKGESHGCAKLKEEDVIHIRRLVAEGHRQVDIAKMYQVTRQAIFQIKNNIHWKHI